MCRFGIAKLIPLWSRRVFGPSSVATSSASLKPAGSLGGTGGAARRGLPGDDRSMGDVLGLGLTHYPMLCGPDDGMAILLSMTLADPDLPAALVDPTSWPDAMRSEWGDDRGATAAGRHRSELVSALSRVRAALDEFR